MSHRRDRDEDRRDARGAGDADADDPTIPYEKRTIPMTGAHRWKASPGHNILVLDAGAVRLEYPHAWRVIPKSNRLQIHDRPPPDDEGRFQITVFRLPKVAGKSWDALPVDELLRHAVAGDPRDKKQRKAAEARTLVHDVTSVRRPDLEYAWVEHQAPDPETGRPLMSRQVIARARGVQPLITFDYYASRADDYRPVWQHAINTLRLGTPVSLLGDVIN